MIVYNVSAPLSGEKGGVPFYAPLFRYGKRAQYILTPSSAAIAYAFPPGTCGTRWPTRSLSRLRRLWAPWPRSIARRRGTPSCWWASLRVPRVGVASRCVVARVWLTERSERRPSRTLRKTRTEEDADGRARADAPKRCRRRRRLPFPADTKLGAHTIDSIVAPAPRRTYR